jgi:hypothetical protein
VAPVYLVILLLGLNLALWLYFYRRFRTSFSPAAILAEIRGEMDGLITEINRTTARCLDLLKAEEERVEHRCTPSPPAAPLPPQPAPPPPPAPPPAPPPTPQPPKSTRDQALELHHAGVPLEEIAQKLHISLVEVQLYTSL